MPFPGCVEHHTPRAPAGSKKVISKVDLKLPQMLPWGYSKATIHHYPMPPLHYPMKSFALTYQYYR